MLAVSLAAVSLLPTRLPLSTTRPCVRRRPCGVMSLPLDVGQAAVVGDAISNRFQAIACAVPMVTAVVATRSSTGIPQIVEMFSRKTPRQVAAKWGPRVFFGDAVVYMSRMAYHMRRGYALSCWSELIPLLLQNLACFMLASRPEESAEGEGSDKLLARPWARRTNRWLKLALDMGFLSALGFAMYRLPSRLLPVLCLWSVPLSISSYVVQAFETERMGPRSTSRAGWALRFRWIGSLVRVLTTAHVLGNDVAAMSNHAVGLVGCSILLLQRSTFERDGPTKVQTRYALYSQLIGKQRDPHDWLPRSIDATLHAWRSLGGFGAAKPPAISDILCSRRAFDAIDEEGTGRISTAQLVKALLSGDDGVSRADAEELAQRMVVAADLDGDGLIDFDEYCAVLQK